jgi:hypothetical protein
VINDCPSEYESTCLGSGESRVDLRSKISHLEKEPFTQQSRFLLQFYGGSPMAEHCHKFPQGGACSHSGHQTGQRGLEKADSVHQRPVVLERQIDPSFV